MVKTDSRKLTYFETLLYFAHQNGTSQMTKHLTLTGNITVDNIRTSLQTLFNKHPLLRSRIHAHNDTLSFHCDLLLSDIPIHTDSSLPTHLIQNTVNAIATQLIDLTQYNWTANIYLNRNQTDIVFHFSHVIADGLSVFNLLHEFLSLLDQSNDIDMTPYSLYPGCEQHLADRCTIQRWQANSTFTDLAPVELERLPQTEVCSLPFINTTIHAQQTKDLLLLASKNKISLNSILNAALIHAYWEITGKPTSIDFGSALSLRNKCQPRIPTDICGNYFASVTTYISSENRDKSLIDLASHYHHQLKKVIDSRHYLPNHYNHSDMVKTVKAFMTANNTTLFEKIGSSYLGTLPFNPVNIKIKRFSSRLKTSQRINMMSHLYNDQLNIQLYFPHEYRSYHWAHQLLQLIERHLMKSI